MRCVQGLNEVVLLPVRHGAATRVRDIRGRTPLDAAARGGIQAALLAEAARNKRCAVCGAGGKLKTCSRCKDMSYCSASCQRVHWPEHRSSCHQRE